MEVIDAIRDRVAIRQFKSEVIQDDILFKILEAARWAPSPFNLQPWEFIIIREKETLKAISKFARYSGYLEDAPMAVAVVVPHIGGKFEWIENISEPRFAAAMAVQNIMLAAWKFGIGTCWVSIDREKVGDILNVPGVDFVLTVIPMGYPAKPPLKHNENSRKEIKDSIYFEKYGNKN